MNLYEELGKYTEQNETKIVDLCSRLIQCPSENPPGDTTAAAKLIVAQLDEWGITSRLVGPRSDAPNLIATVEGRGPGRHLVFNGHLDVFPAGDRGLWEYDPFGGEVVGGRIYGRGSTDMKGGLTASLWAFHALARNRDAWSGRATFTAVSEEETFGPDGARYLVEAHGAEVLGDALINGEPSGTEVLYCGSRGILWLRLTVKAEGGHSAIPHGRSAIHGMLTLLTDLDHRVRAYPFQVPADVEAVIDASREVADARSGKGVTDALLRISTNIGVLRGGASINMKAESCTAEYDVRLPPGVMPDNLIALAREVVEAHPGASVEVMNQFAPSFSDPSAPIYAAVAAASRDVLGQAPAPTISHAAGDHRLWNWAGVPAAVFGPHTNNIAAANEFVTVADLTAMARIHTLAAVAFLTADQAD